MTFYFKSAYQKAVVENFNFLKSAKTIHAAFLRAIPIDQEHFLLPVCHAHKDDIQLIEVLTHWRNKNVEVYPTQFIATLESTENWLSNRLLAVEDRILFLVIDKVGSVLGHIGFNGCINDECFFEIDNVIKGDDNASKGLFSKALHSLIEWARATLNVEGFFLKVMDDNAHAISFYKKNGFTEDVKIPLIKEEKNEVIIFTEASKSNNKVDKYFIKMKYEVSTEDIGDAMILTAGPSISAKEAVYAYDAALYGWNSNWSKYLSLFESKFAEYVGAKYALATSSCTGALQIALMALDIGPEDEVILPDETWVATANAVRYVGATPIFADVEMDTWNIDSQSIENLITDKTKAIIPVHMYGTPARMDSIMAIAKKYDLKVVEDSAPAIGAEWQGQRCGSFGDFAGFSFQGAKLLVTGEGGMLVTNNEELYKKALKIWNQGRNPSSYFWIDVEGVKFKMSNIQAAIGLAQLERADELIEMKRRIFSWYEEGLQGVTYIQLNKEIDNARSVYWMTSIIVNEGSPIARDELMLKLKEKNVDTRPVFPAISQYPIWKIEQKPKTNALHIGLNAMNLPSGVCLTKVQVMYVCEQIKLIMQ